MELLNWHKLGLLVALALALQWSLVHGNTIKEFPPSPTRSWETTKSFSCIINDRANAAANPVIWRRGATNLFVERNRVLNIDERYSLTGVGNNFTFVISTPNCTDKGPYTCDILGGEAKDTQYCPGYFNPSTVDCSHILSNDNKKIDITCNANGCPKPDLEITDNMGPSSKSPPSDETTCGNACPCVPKENTVNRTQTFTTSLQYNYTITVVMDNIAASGPSNVFTKMYSVDVIIQATPQEEPFPVWAIVLIVILILAVIGGICVGVIICLKKKKQSGGSKPGPYEAQILLVTKTGVEEIKGSLVGVAGIPLTLRGIGYGAHPPAQVKWYLQHKNKEEEELPGATFEVENNKAKPGTKDTHSTLEYVPKFDHDGALLYCAAINNATDPVSSHKIEVQIKNDGDMKQSPTRSHHKHSNNSPSRNGSRDTQLTEL